MCRALWGSGRDLARIQKFATKEWALELALLPTTRARFSNALLDGAARPAEVCVWGGAELQISGRETMILAAKAAHVPRVTGTGAS